MSTSSSKSAKRGEDGMGKEGKIYAMVKDIYMKDLLVRELLVCLYVFVCVCV